MWYKFAQTNLQQPSLFFDPWAEGHEIKDENGWSKPLYHGSTHEFDAFDVDKARAESYYGKGIYLTDSPLDASKNYANPEGPDLKGHIGQVIDNLRNYHDQDSASFNNSYGIDEDYEWEEDELEKFIEEQANKVAVGNNQGTIYPLYAKMKNPVYIRPNGGTYLEMEYDEDEDGDIIPDSERGTYMDFLNALRDTAADYEVDGEEIIEELSQKVDMYDSSLYEVVIALRENEKLSEDLLEHSWDSGKEDDLLGEFVKDIIQRMGYDGIIMDAYSHFGPKQHQWGRTVGMDGINKGDNHYVVWNPEQVKSAIGNNGLYNPEVPKLNQ